MDVNWEKCENVIENGHVKCLKYAYKNGCSVDNIENKKMDIGQLECKIFLANEEMKLRCGYYFKN
jgi:hypothetical protein